MLVSTRVATVFVEGGGGEGLAIVAVPEEDVAKQHARTNKRTLASLKGKTKLIPHSSHFFF